MKTTCGDRLASAMREPLTYLLFRLLGQKFCAHTHLGTIHSEMPTTALWEKFRRLHAEHQERLYEESRKGLTLQERRKAEKLEKALNPRKPFEELLERARLILPQITDNTKASDQGRINVAEMRRLLKIPHNTAYNLRKELLKELHEKEV